MSGVRNRVSPGLLQGWVRDAGACGETSLKSRLSLCASAYSPEAGAPRLLPALASGRLRPRAPPPRPDSSAGLSRPWGAFPPRGPGRCFLSPEAPELHACLRPRRWEETLGSWVTTLPPGPGVGPELPAGAASVCPVTRHRFPAGGTSLEPPVLVHPSRGPGPGGCESKGVSGGPGPRTAQRPGALGARGPLSDPPRPLCAAAKPLGLAGGWIGDEKSPARAPRTTLRLRKIVFCCKTNRERTWFLPAAPEEATAGT